MHILEEILLHVSMYEYVRANDFPSYNKMLCLASGTLRGCYNPIHKVLN